MCCANRAFVGLAACRDHALCFDRRFSSGGSSCDRRRVDDPDRAGNFGRAVGRYPRLRLGIGLYQSGGLSSPADRLKLKSVGGAAIADQFRNDRLSSSNWRFARLKVASGLMAKIPNAIAPAVADVAAFSKRFRAG